MGHSIYNHRTTELYWQLVQSMMSLEGLYQRAAEVEVFRRHVKRARENGFPHRTIQRQLTEMWGLSHGAYYRRLARARQTICIP